MKNYEIKLSQKVTQEVQRYLNDGYIFRNSDSTHGFDIKVELVNPNIPDEFIRIWVKTEYKRYSDKEENSLVQNLNNNVLRVGVFNIRESFKEDYLLLYEVYYTDPNNENLFIEDLDEAKRISDLRSERFKRDYSSYTKTFKPTRKLNIPGFKSLDPQYVRITRKYKRNGLGSNEYIVENTKNGKIKTISY